MKLSEYLCRNGLSAAEFATTVGTTAATLCRVLHGQVVPRRGLMVEIHRTTDGQVTPNDLLGLHGAGGEHDDCIRGERDD